MKIIISAVFAILAITVFTPTFARHYGSTAYTCTKGPEAYSCYACCWSSKAKQSVKMEGSMACDVPGNPSYTLCDKSQAVRNQKNICETTGYFSNKPRIQYGTWAIRAANKLC